MIRSDLDPNEFGKEVESWAQMGAEIIGGCCGIGPEYIPKIVSAF